MSRQYKNVSPIKSQETIKLLSRMLEKQNEDFSLIFLLIVKTGIPLRYLLNKKVSDLYKKDTITYENMHSKNSTVTHKEFIPKDLQDKIANRLEGRAPHEWAFLGSRSKTKMYPRSFDKALETVCITIGINPPYTITALRKTFVYYLWLKDPKKAYKHSSARSNNDMLTYLQLTPFETPQLGSVREKFYSSEVLDITSDAINATIKNIRETTENPDNVKDEYYQRVFTLCNSITEAIESFNNFTSE